MRWFLRSKIHTATVTEAKVEYVGLVGGAYAIVVGLVAAGLLGLWGLLVLLSLPIAIGNASKVLAARAGDSSPIIDADVRSAKLHLLFCVLLAAGLLISALT